MVEKITLVGGPLDGAKVPKPKPTTHVLQYPFMRTRELRHNDTLEEVLRDRKQDIVMCQYSLADDGTFKFDYYFSTSRE